MAKIVKDLQQLEGIIYAFVYVDGSLSIEVRHESDNKSWRFVETVQLTPEGVKALIALLSRADELRNEADDVGQSGLVREQTMYECGNCGVPRFVHGVILEACPNCGDDETDLSLIDEVP